MSLIIAVTSGKGGAGKSTFSIGTAIAEAAAHKNVLLVDMDAGMRCLDMLLSVSEKVLFDLSDAVGGQPLENCVLPIPGHPGLFLLPAPSEPDAFSPDAFGDFVKAAAEKYDSVILDFPAGPDASLLAHLPYETQFVCICNPDPVSVRDAGFVGTALRKLGKSGLLVLNKYSYYYIKNSFFANLDDIIDQTGMKLLGIVPESEYLEYAFCSGKFPKKGREYKAFCRIAERLAGKNVPLPKLDRI